MIMASISDIYHDKHYVNRLRSIDDFYGAKDRQSLIVKEVIAIGAAAAPFLISVYRRATNTGHGDKLVARQTPKQIPLLASVYAGCGLALLTPLEFVDQVDKDDSPACLSGPR